MSSEILVAVVLFFAVIGLIATIRWLRSQMRRLVGGGATAKAVQPQRTAKSVKRGAGYVVDGSNVLYWAGDGPELASLLAVLKRLRGKQSDIHVFFDASVGYKLFNRHVNAGEMASTLNLPADAVTIVPGGTDADVFLLQYAARHRDTIVSNDRFKDNAKLAKGLPRMRGVVSGGRAVFDG